MTQTRFFVVLLVMALTVGATSRAADPKPAAPPDPCVTDLTLEKLDNPPERKTKYEESKDPWVANLYDVKVVDQKYVAFIHIRLPHRTGSPYSSENGDGNFGRVSHYLSFDEHKELAALQLVYPTAPLLATRTQDFSRSSADSSFLRRRNELQSIGWQRMLAQIPPERQPAKEVQEFFKSQMVAYYVFFNPPGGGFTGIASRREQGELSVYRTLYVLGATRAEAEARAKALLTILDQGFSRPIQKGLLQIRGEYCQQYRDSQEKVAAAKKEYEALQAEFKEYADFPSDTLAGLRVQLFQWDAELAGLQAKIEACDKLINAGAAGERAKQIEEAKVAAEIELAGCKARRAKSADFIAKVKRREELTSKRDEASNRWGRAGSQLHEIAARIQVIDEEIETFGPVRVVEDTVSIQPVEWTKE
jgi:hypothetical protein